MIQVMENITITLPLKSKFEQHLRTKRHCEFAAGLQLLSSEDMVFGDQIEYLDCSVCYSSYNTNNPFITL